MPHPRVTVLMPVHNAVQYVDEAIRSVLSQTFRNYELLIVDDGSTDGSDMVIESHRDSRIRLLRNTSRLKLSGALNLGLHHAKGEYVARMDADDLCFPDRLERQVAYMDAHPEVGLCGSNVRTFGEHPSSGLVFKYPVRHEDIRATALFDNPFAHPSVIMRKSFFDVAGLHFNAEYYPTEDYELWVRCLDKFKVANLARSVLMYRLHAKSMTLSGVSDMDEQSIRVIRPLFYELGMNPSNDDLYFHRLISTNRLPDKWSQEDMRRAEAWLMSVISATRKSAKYDLNAIRSICRKVWYSICYRSIQCDWYSPLMTIRSPLLRCSIYGARDCLVLLLVSVLGKGWLGMIRNAYRR